MDDTVRQALRPIYASGLETELVKELIPTIPLEDLKTIKILCNEHVSRMTLKWYGRLIIDLSDGRLYHILKGNYRNRKSVLAALRLEAEMRGVLVDGKLKDPAIDHGSRTLPYGLLEQCDE